jgi:transposase
MLSFKSLYTHTTGQELTLSKLKEMEIKEAQELYEHPANQLIAGMQIKHIEQLTESSEKIEKAVLGSARELPYYEKLATLPGVGRILGMTITMEVGDIKRFADPGHFASYCRTAEAKRMSNNKKKGENNSKCGNSTWPGRLWKRPTSRGATTRSARNGLSARWPEPATSLRSRRWPAS